MKIGLKLLLVVPLLCVCQNVAALMLGNFTTHDFRVMILDNKVQVLRRDFVLDDQHYTDLGDISKDRLPLIVKVWSKDVLARDDSSMLAEFKIESVPDEEIMLRDNDIWLIYRDPEEEDEDDEEMELKITNLSNQDDVVQPEIEKLPPTPTPEPLPPAKKAQEVQPTEPTSAPEAPTVA